MIIHKNTMNNSSTTLSISLPAKILAYLQMMRPANIVTAWADILAGAAATGLFAVAMPSGHLWQVQSWSLDGLTYMPALLWLLLATSGLYGGGVVFNDVFDAELDAVERPERPIPSGRSTKRAAIALGLLLLVVGAIAAAQVSWLSGGLAIATALSALLYDSVSKHSVIFGPLNMGTCRGLNLLLGISILPAMVFPLSFLAIIPILYIGAITAISQGEVSGGKQQTGVLSLFLIGSVIGIILGLSLLPHYQIWTVLPFTILFGALTLPAFITATRTPTPECIRTAVRAGILSLIVLDASLAGGFAGISYGLAILALLPLSRGLAKVFSVT